MSWLFIVSYQKSEIILYKLLAVFYLPVHRYYFIYLSLCYNKNGRNIYPSFCSLMIIYLLLYVPQKEKF